MRRIMHIDMNSFFASCEMANDESLRGKNIAVAGDPAKRHGIILAASYEAKKKGVKTTMPIWKAQNVCKDLIILPCNMELYASYSDRMIEIVSQYAPVIEKASIDEAYLDLTGTEKIYPDLLILAKEIQDRIYNELGLMSSIGISENKLLAKMGSDYKKPMGITEIYLKDVKDKLWNLKTGELFGIGNKTEEMLKSIGIFTIGMLAQYDFNTLKLYAGDRGARYLIDSANGIDDSEVIPNDMIEAKSTGLEKTFSEDITDIKILNKTLFEFSEKISYRLREMNKKAKTIVIKIKYSNFTNITRNYTLDAYTDLQNEIYEVAKLLLIKSLNNDISVRLIGLSCTKFISNDEDYSQITLLETNEEKIMKEKNERYRTFEKTLDKLRTKYGEDVVKKAKNIEKNK